MLHLDLELKPSVQTLLGGTQTMASAFPYDSSAFAPLTSSKLLWRWTSRTHALFPAHVLAAMMAFNSSEALARHAEALLRVPDPTDRAGTVMECGDDVPEEKVSTWLSGLSADAQAWTVLSWDRTTAILIPWKHFAERWSDFCYPASDDVTIWQPHQLWTLEFEHEESFRYFG